MLRVADKNKNSLVVITADHETGGFGILQGEKGSNKIEGDFLTNDHTGGMVPVFSYGPRSKYFIGVYENTKIFDKILEVMEVSRWCDSIKRPHINTSKRSSEGSRI